MRGAFTDQGQLFSYISPEARVRTDHPLRKIRELVRDVLRELNRSLSRLYASEGRPSIPPEQLLSALLQQQLVSCLLNFYAFIADYDSLCICMIRRLRWPGLLR